MMCFELSDSQIAVNNKQADIAGTPFAHLSACLGDVMHHDIETPPFPERRHDRLKKHLRPVPGHHHAEDIRCHSQVSAFNIVEEESVEKDGEEHDDEAEGEHLQYQPVDVRALGTVVLKIVQQLRNPVWAVTSGSPARQKSQVHNNATAVTHGLTA